jgi:hypothetical protein
VTTEAEWRRQARLLWDVMTPEMKADAVAVNAIVERQVERHVRHLKLAGEIDAPAVNG